MCATFSLCTNFPICFNGRCWITDHYHCVWISVSAYLKVVSSFTALHYLWRLPGLLAYHVHIGGCKPSIIICFNTFQITNIHLPCSWTEQSRSYFSQSFTCCKFWFCFIAMTRFWNKNNTRKHETLSCVDLKWCFPHPLTDMERWSQNVLIEIKIFRSFQAILYLLYVDWNSSIYLSKVGFFTVKKTVFYITL